MFTRAGFEVCECCLRHQADLLPMDGCGCPCPDQSKDGHLWGRVQSISPQDASGTGLGLISADNCPSGTLNVVMEIGVHRCIALTEDGSAPPCDVLSQEAYDFLADEELLRMAVFCCNVEDLPGEYQLRADAWRPVGPAGGCAGGVLTVIATGEANLILPPLVRGVPHA